MENCLKLLTFLELDEIKALTEHRDERINAAKLKLAYEVTKLIHGDYEALRAQEQAAAAFSGKIDNMPSINMDKNITKILDILVETKAALSKAEGRRLIEGGGVFINDEKISDFNYEIPKEILSHGEFVLHKGKKLHLRVIYN